ncbi:3-phenylpropionate MFS transporter [Vibrio salinus]|uniref:3-phenylpropionate MFS transporter n=1 Tax=Vibrio salinus TaxID=2899784 RepID=UPI001E413243|nr:3-phenylpropionate MFS transporter [Vibrio salinus]MCE0493832.1 3-phenylpropionate MFS transporter [Vibrio salinus]
MLKTTPFRWASQFFFGFFFVYGVYLPFWALWLKYEGMDPGQIGILVGVAFATRCAVNLILTPRIHRAEKLVPVLRWLSLISIASLVLFSFSNNFYWLLLVTVLFNLCIGPTMPLSDSVANYYSKLNLLDYGRSRLWGSFAFIVGSTLVGWLAVHLGGQVILYTALAGACALLLMSVRNPDPYPVDSDTGRSRKGESLIRLLKNKSVVLFLVLVACIQGSHAAYYGFSSIYWKSVGYSEETIGYLWSLGVIAEIIVFAVSKTVFSGWTIRGLFMLSSCAVIVRWGVTALTYELFALVFVQLFHSLTFASAHIAAIRYIQNAPNHLMVPLQALYNAIPLGLVIAILTPMSGWGFEHWGGKVFLAMSAMGVIALFVPVRLLGKNGVGDATSRELSAGSRSK